MVIDVTFEGVDVAKYDKVLMLFLNYFIFKQIFMMSKECDKWYLLNICIIKVFSLHTLF